MHRTYSLHQEGGAGGRARARGGAALQPGGRGAVVGQGPIGVAHPPGQRALRVVAHDGGVGGVVGQVAQLVRVGGQIEQ